MITAAEFLKWLDVFGVRSGEGAGTVTSITAGTGLTGGTIISHSGSAGPFLIRGGRSDDPNAFLRAFSANESTSYALCKRASVLVRSSAKPTRRRGRYSAVEAVRSPDDPFADCFN